MSMTKVSYVVKTKKGQCEVTRLARALEIIGEFGGTYSVKYSKVKKKTEPIYVGLTPKKPYKPPYIDPIYNTK